MVSTATEAVTLQPDAFMRLVTEKHLQVEGPSLGWLYAGVQGKHGWELYKAPGNGWYLLQGRYVVTQDNAGGGALALNVSGTTGQVLILKSMRIVGPVTNTTLVGVKNDEDGAEAVRMATNGAAANNASNHPQPGSGASSTANIADTRDMWVGPGESIRFTAAASAQTETLTMAFSFLSNMSTAPTVATTGSAGTPNLAASTISATNASQLVALP